MPRHLAFYKAYVGNVNKHGHSGACTSKTAYPRGVQRQVNVVVRAGFVLSVPERYQAQGELTYTRCSQRARAVAGAFFIPV